jgi:hypothetical protein
MLGSVVGVCLPTTFIYKKKVIKQKSKVLLTIKKRIAQK